MHPKNRYRGRHDFTRLVELEPELQKFLYSAPDGHQSLRFAEARAVYLLNRTLLKRDYGLTHWDIPSGNLTPPVPGRLDYIHALAELAPSAERVLDIGTGASLIYPILGVKEYGWAFVGSDIDRRSVRVARAIISFNRGLGGITVRLQTKPQNIFTNIIGTDERFDLTMCNPPFYASIAAAQAATGKKWEKLGRGNAGRSFAGSDAELHTPGGEPRFLATMIEESKEFGDRVGWFTTLVSKKGYLTGAYTQLERIGVKEHRKIELAQGNKRMRVLAWRFW